MTDIHPHWRSESAEQNTTDTTPVKVRVRDDRPRGKLRTVSRTPAAIAGIAVAIVAGYAALGGEIPFIAQTNPPAATEPAAAAAGEEDLVIHITPDGPRPVRFAVAQGGSLVWSNEDTMPHILAATDTEKGIMTASGSALYTSAIFPGSFYSISIAKDAPLGEFEYSSITKPSWKGTILVKEPTVITNREALPDTVFGGSTGIPLPGLGTNTYETSTKVEQPPQPEPEPAAPAELPYNPYTVASTTQDDNLPPVAHASPPRQPDSGSAEWIVVLLSVGIAAVAFRKDLAAIAVRR